MKKTPAYYQMRRDAEKIREEYAKTLDYEIRFYQDGECIHIWRNVPYEDFYNGLRQINCKSDTLEILGIREEIDSDELRQLKVQELAKEFFRNANDADDTD